jgi:dihydroxy-acid dehydratase
MDAVVLIGGCDKTVPAQLMGAASADIPAIQLVTGPMMTGAVPGRAARRLHRLPALLGAVPRRQRDRRTDRRDRGAAGHHRGHLRRDGHRVSTMACDGRDAGHDACRARRRSPRCTPTACARRGGGTLAMRLTEAPIRPSEVITAKSVENALRVLLAHGRLDQCA